MRELTIGGIIVAIIYALFQGFFARIGEKTADRVTATYQVDDARQQAEAEKVRASQQEAELKAAAYRAEAERLQEQARQAAANQVRANQEVERRVEAERQTRAEADQLARQNAVRDQRMKQIQQQEAEQIARIQSSQRIEATLKAAAEARGCQYQGNGISVCPGKGY